MTAFVKAVMHMKCGQRGRGLTSIEAVREIRELVRKTHHVDPYTEKSIRSNTS
jgi:hypothetical protein